MDIHALRREIVRELIRVRFKGSKAEFSRASGIAESTVSSYLSDPPRKKIGEKIAVKLEAKADLGLRPGQLLDPKPIERGDFSHITEFAAVRSDDGVKNMVLMDAETHRKFDSGLPIASTSDLSHLALAIAHLLDTLRYDPEAHRRLFSAMQLAYQNEMHRQRETSGPAPSPSPASAPKTSRPKTQ